MRDFVKWVIAATVGATALTCIGVGAAAAADVPVPQRQAQPEYYPPAEEHYVYPAPPPPVYRYYYGPPVVAVVPPIYPYYGPRWYGPRFARGYGHYGRPWRYRHW